MRNLIETTDVQKTFGQRKVLQGVSLSVRPGEIVGLVGPNGSGKTTLIRLLNGLIAPDKGKIRIDGCDPMQDGNIIRARSGTLTEEASFYEELSGFQNLHFFAKLYGVHDTTRIEKLLSDLDLTHAKHFKVGTYSTGMKKRLGIAKVLLHQPDILFLDEPTNGLDPEGIQLIKKIILEINQKMKTTILICSHYLSQLESLCHRYLFIESGKILEQGSQKELAERYLQEILLKVETTYQHPENRIGSFFYQRLLPDEIVFRLQDKEDIPKVLNQLTTQAKVYAAEIMNRDLETLYFEVKKRNHE